MGSMQAHAGRSARDPPLEAVQGVSAGKGGQLEYHVFPGAAVCGLSQPRVWLPRMPVLRSLLDCTGAEVL